jgi:hypothetical protein
MRFPWQRSVRRSLNEHVKTKPSGKSDLSSKSTSTFDVSSHDKLDLQLISFHNLVLFLL